jgi:hypothetical protein
MITESKSSTTIPAGNSVLLSLLGDSSQKQRSGITNNFGGFT